MNVQPPFVLMLLAAMAGGGGPQIASTSHRKVSWGYGCGGNCAVNYSGQSGTLLRDKSSKVRIEDSGSLTQRTSDPGGIMTITTDWKYTFHGTSSGGDDRREFDLRTGKTKCARSQKTMTTGKPDSEKQIACPSPPKEWKLVCERKEITVNGESRQAWVCSPADHAENFGTEFPWVFGIESSITTVVSGEPHPRTTYTSSEAGLKE